MAVTTRAEADSTLHAIEKVQFTPSTDVTVTSDSSYKVGNIVVFNMTFKRSGASITTLGYVGEKFRPSETVQFGTASSDSSGSWAIGSGGNVVIGTTITATANIRLNGVYAIE